MNEKVTIYIVKVDYGILGKHRFSQLGIKEIDFSMLPQKGDYIHFQDKRYRVEQRDFFLENGNKVKIYVVEL